jgi:hypothetical protein
MTTSKIVSLPIGIMVAAATLLFTGCGLAETTAVAASEAESAAKQVEEGKKLEENVMRDIDAANQAAADARAKTEETLE